MKRHVVITGGGGEIGFAMAREFAAAGAAVTLLDKVLPSELNPEVEAIGATFRQVDVTDADSVNAVVGGLDEIDVAVANAGVHRGARFLDLSPEAWRLMFDVNAGGVFLFCQAVARRMVRRARGGNIVVTGSWVQDVPHVDNTAYCASKAAAAMVARCMALELAEHGIRVNVVAPGIVNAGMAARQLKIDPVFAATATQGIPLGRLQTAEQVARATAFLCSDEAESITGMTMLVDGGLSLFKR
ncbi:SDR family NAD(P)-dependent oxidoreductase [Bradyrhizobium sp. WSM3983]|uniref:SDR family NAD(P)-dependent oxidoreductase n=1 Tax=Bradyrhizobium sp. WSM3983 TaxID=1038867 RepID=UPI000489E8FD|nr:SDR family oxidoreductase [Bradyrhizobium sp. WSM3983]